MTAISLRKVLPGIKIYEGKIHLRKPRSSPAVFFKGAIGTVVYPSTLVFHQVVVDPSCVDLTPLVNESSHDIYWGDATVRGYVPLPFPEREVYYSQIKAKFRRFTLASYRANLDHLCHTPLSGRILMVADANGNLFWNLGQWVFTQGVLYQHFREKLVGSHTALFMDQAENLQIGALNLDQPLEVKWAISGTRIIREGRSVNLAEIDPDTQRPLLAEFYGDFNQVIQGGFSPLVSRALFRANVELYPQFTPLPRMLTPIDDTTARILGRDFRGSFGKTSTLSPLIRAAYRGEAAEFIVEKDKDVLEEKLQKAGYRKGKLSRRGTYQINPFRIRFKRATFGHSLISTTEEGKLLLTKTYSDPFTRKGLTIEDTARLAKRSASLLGFSIKDGILTSSGGDIRIEVENKLLKESLSGETLLFWGEEEYGITSVLIFSQK